MISGQSLENEVKKVASKILGLKEIDWINLPGDASNRRYVRLKAEDETRILMILNAPETFKSEEATTQEKTEVSNELDFVRVQRSWAGAGIKLPRIDYIDPANRFIISEDLGDELLYDRRQRENALSFYKKALDELIKIQNLPNEFPYRKSSFTEKLFEWELEHFIEYAIEKREKKISEVSLKEIRSSFHRWVEKISRISPCVVHRDFHSKNIMLLGNGEVRLIDFQDALAGPEVYDLASLLRDSYVQFSETEENELLKYFNSARERPIEYESFCLVSLQRNMKAVGRFFYISMVKKRDTHLPYVQPSLQRIFKSLKEINEKSLLDILTSVMEGDY